LRLFFIKFSESKESFYQDGNFGRMSIYFSHLFDERLCIKEKAGIAFETRFLVPRKFFDSEKVTKSEEKISKQKIVLRM